MDWDIVQNDSMPCTSQVASHAQHGWSYSGMQSKLEEQPSKVIQMDESFSEQYN